ncbi:hypothetical protein P7C73_g5647, partial [Tremellales sp. Uapishka_1]
MDLVSRPLPTIRCYPFRPDGQDESEPPLGFTPLVFPPSSSSSPSLDYRDLRLIYRNGCSTEAWSRVEGSRCVQNRLIRKYNGFQTEQDFHSVFWTPFVQAHSIPAKELDDALEELEIQGRKRPEWSVEFIEKSIRTLAGDRWDELATVREIRKADDEKKATLRRARAGVVEIGQSPQLNVKLEVQDPLLPSTTSQKKPKRRHTSEPASPRQAEDPARRHHPKTVHRPSQLDSALQGATTPDFVLFLHAQLMTAIVVILIIEMKWVSLKSVEKDDKQRSVPVFHYQGYPSEPGCDILPGEPMLYAIREAIYQTSWYLCNSAHLWATRMAIANVNEFYFRIVSLDVNTLIIETDTLQADTQPPFSRLSHNEPSASAVDISPGPQPPIGDSTSANPRASSTSEPPNELAKPAVTNSRRPPPLNLAIRPGGERGLLSVSQIEDLHALWETPPNSLLKWEDGAFIPDKDGVDRLSAFIMNGLVVAGTHQPQTNGSPHREPPVPDYSSVDLNAMTPPTVAQLHWQKTGARERKGAALRKIKGRNDIAGDRASGGGAGGEDNDDGKGDMAGEDGSHAGPGHDEKDASQFDGGGGAEGPGDDDATRQSDEDRGGNTDHHDRQRDDECTQQGYEDGLGGEDDNRSDSSADSSIFEGRDELARVDAKFLIVDRYEMDYMCAVLANPASLLKSSLSADLDLYLERLASVKPLSGSSGSFSVATPPLGEKEVAKVHCFESRPDGERITAKRSGNWSGLP